MTVQNAKIQEHDFLRDMYADGYFPNFLVDKIKAILIELCEELRVRTRRVRMIY